MLLSYQERLIAEKTELSDRLDKLRTFNNSGQQFAALAYAEQGRLLEQEHVMQRYLEILVQRIAAFPVT